MEKLVLIDGNSLINRAFYATKLLTTREGVPTNGVFGFTKLLLKIISDIKPAYMVVAFDLKAPTFRHKMFENYKGTRKPMPDELAAQMPIMKSLLSALNIRMCEKEGYEADDLIGTLSRKFEDRVHSIIILSTRQFAHGRLYYQDGRERTVETNGKKFQGTDRLRTSAGRGYQGADGRQFG